MDPFILFASALRFSGYVVYPALGEAFSELSGVYNVGTEGIMLTSAATSFLGALITGNPMLGLLIGVLSGGLIGAIQALFAVHIGADQIVFGLGVIFLGPFLSSIVARRAIGGRIYLKALAPTFPSFEIEGIGYPLNIILKQNVLFYASLPLAVVLWFLLFRTRFGLAVRAVGENGYVAASNGINVVMVRYACSIIGGAIAAMGGVFVILGLTGIWSDNLTGGRGFVAIAMVRVGLFKPFLIFLACVLYGLVDSFQLAVQASTTFPYQFLQMIPYSMGIIALIISSLFRVFREPADLGKPFVKEQR